MKGSKVMKGMQLHIYGLCSLQLIQRDGTDLLLIKLSVCEWRKK